MIKKTCKCSLTQTKNTNSSNQSLMCDYLREWWMSKVKHTFLLVDDKKYQQYMVSNIAMLWNLTDKFQFNPAISHICTIFASYAWLL